MHSVVARILFTSNRHCFALLPKSLTCKCSKDKIDVIKVESPTGCLVTSWSGDVSGNQPNGCVDDVIEINGFFALKLGFQNGQEVTVTLLPTIGDCASAQVEPASVDDWEILEMNAANVESNLLNQVRVVSVGQVFPIWVQRTTCVFVTVGSMEPSFNICLLQPNTELVISPKSRSPSGTNHRRHEPSQTSHNRTADAATTSPKTNGVLPTATSNPGLQPMNNSVDSPMCLQDSVEHDDDSARPNGLLSYLMSFLWQTEAKTEISDKPRVQEKLLSREFCTSFRVLPLEDFVEVKSKNIFVSGSYQQNGLEPSLRSSDIFVTEESFSSISSFPTLEHCPETFLAQISKLPSPAEKREASKSKTKLKFPDELTLKTVDKVNQISVSEATDETSDADPVVTVRVVILKSGKFCSTLPGGIEFVGQKTVPLCHVLIQSDLRRMLCLESMSRIQMDALMTCNDIVPDEIGLYRLFQMPDGFTDNMLVLAFRQWAELVTQDSCPLVLNQGTIFRCFIKEGFSGEFFVTIGSHSEAKERPFCLLSRHLLQLVKLKFVSATKSQATTLQLFPEVEELDFHVSLGFDHLHVDVTTESVASEYIDICLNRHSLAQQLFCRMPGLANGGLLLCGAKGSGKSALGGAICHRVTCHPNYAFAEVVDCKKLKGKKPEIIRQHLEQKFDELSWRQPSVLFLDDLDHIAAPSGGPDQDMSGLAMYHARVAEIVEDLLQRESLSGSAIAIVASAVSYNSIHPKLVSPRGNHVFTRIIEIKPPNQADQAEILRLMLKNRKDIAAECISDLSLLEIASQMEGFLPRDLEMVVNRALHASLLQSSSSCTDDVVLNDSHFKDALKDFTPAALRSVSLVRPEDLSWADVGGLHEVRSVLIQTLQWPSKHPKLFASCPLRLRSGLLLYGAPGTGKTHLAAVVAREFKLNFISIKGPELFNKYIGASEQAVRDTFTRAQSAKPCILFFDEFDSLAPRRGHDNTGVTDRVVNQLLTQLDGVESLEGVFVLAATSRPDLIDPALLRPGRLDKALHCPIPSKAESLEIIQALSRKMQLTDDVDLEFIANKCENFTGADFKALLYNAQLEAIHETTSAIIESKEVSSESEAGLHPSDADASVIINVTQDHLLRACHGLQPSVSASERRKYHRIYESFVGSREGNFVADATENVGQRITLA